MTEKLTYPTLLFGAKVIEEMSPEDCVTLLAKTTNVGRVAFCSSDGQQLLPVNFVFQGDRLYFLTSSESTLAELANGCGDVAFEIDYADRMTQHGWSVLVRGATRAAVQGGLTDDLPFRSPRPWAPGTREVLIELVPGEIAGRRIRSDIPPHR